MKKVTESERDDFRNEFMHYVDMLRCKDWGVMFESSDDPSLMASIVCDHGLRECTVQLCRHYNEKIQGPLNVTELARHEAIHLSLADLSNKAGKRYITIEELLEAEELAVIRLSRMIERLETK